MFAIVAPLAGFAALALIGLIIFSAMCFRVVVPTNDVHIVQSRSKTVSYGKGQAAGNSYYAWPAWMPIIGIRIIRLPVSVFDIQLNEYAAYDKGRVPFVIDILAFFRIEDSNMAAERVSSFDELQAQLEGILKGASRSILAQSPIEEILEERAKYGQMFTDATNDQLKAWGVANVKNVELMDIRDAQGSKSITNIMAVKQSSIEKESRVQVANNKQAAETAEIQAQQAVLIQKQSAEQAVGQREAEKNKQVGISQQQANQEVQEQVRLTTEKEMAVRQVSVVRAAEIERDANIVKAEQTKQVAIVQAEGSKQQTITVAQGNLEQAKLMAEGTRVKGEAEGAAQQAILLAPVNTQITLAKEIGANKEYQTYLVTIEQIKANQVVGVEQAKALEKADIKVIANSGGPVEGVKNVMDLFTPKGGTQIGAMLEALKNTDAGQAVLKAVTNGSGEANGRHAD